MGRRRTGGGGNPPAAQLQPVEAGPAFRLITTRVGVSHLEEVVRQKIEWQREATVLFGKQESQKAIQAYQSRGHIHLVEEELPGNHNPQDVVRRYEMSARTSGLIYREILKDLQTHPEERSFEKGSLYERAKGPEDYPHFLKWREIQKDAGKEILEKANIYRSHLEVRRLDPLEMARLFVDKRQDKLSRYPSSQYYLAREVLKDKKLDHLIGVERAQTVDVRSGAKAALIEDWQKSYQTHPQKVLLMMAYSNRDVRDLNASARDYLKVSGDIERQDFTYIITREVEDDFGRKKKLKEERNFSKGDRVVFTRNNYGLGVKNGSIGQIISLDTHSIEVQLGQEKTLTFSPNVFTFFDQGWAVTIHKSQGATIDKGFLLASHEMNQNLTYVAMTRHREDIQVYGSSCDLWREEKVADILSKYGEKLGAADYLDAHSLSQLMKEEDRFLEKIFTRLSDELHAMGAVSKRSLKNVDDHFLGRASEPSLERPILLKPEVVREEDRAHLLLQKDKEGDIDLVRSGRPEPKERTMEARSGRQVSLDQISHPVTPLSLEGKECSLQDVYEDMKHPAFNKADHYKRVFEEGRALYGEGEAIRYWQSRREPFLKLYEKKLETVENELKSPLLSYLSDESRNLARSAALEDPDKALNRLGQLQASKRAEKEEKARPQAIDTRSQRGVSLQSSLRVSALNDKNILSKSSQEASAAYFKFKELRNELKDSPGDYALRKEIHEIGRSIFKDKEFFAHIEKIDPDISKEIQIEAKIKIHTLDLLRGGYSR